MGMGILNSLAHSINVSQGYREKEKSPASYEDLCLSAKLAERRGHLLAASRYNHRAGEVAAKSKDFPSAYRHYTKAADQAEVILASGKFDSGAQNNIRLGATYCRVFAGKHAMTYSRVARDMGACRADVEWWRKAAFEELYSAKGHIIVLIESGVRIDQIRGLFMEKVQNLGDSGISAFLELPQPKPPSSK